MEAGDQEGLGGGQAAEGQSLGHDRRSQSPGAQLAELIKTSGSLAGAMVAVLAFGGYALDKLPFAKASDIAQVNLRVDSLSGSIASLQVNQLQSLELQLTERVQRLGDQISKLKPDEYNLLGNLRESQNEAQQRLGQVRAQLAAVQRQARSDGP